MTMDFIIERRLAEINEIRQFTNDAKQKLAIIYQEMGWEEPDFNEEPSPKKDQDLESSSNIVTQVPNYVKREDPFLHLDLIKAFHKLSSKQSEESQLNEVIKKNKSRTRSKKKKNVYSSKRLSYTEVLRKLIQNQTDVINHVNKSNSTIELKPNMVDHQ